MIELIRTNDPVLISWLVASLEAEGIGCAVLDHHTSIMEGSIGAIPRRVMVLADDEPAARRVLAGRPDNGAGDGAREDGADNARPAPPLGYAGT